MNTRTSQIITIVLILISLLGLYAVRAVVNLAANDYGYNFSVFSFEDGSHVLQIGKHQVNWCDAGAACDSSDMTPRLELRSFDDPYQG